MRVSAVLFAVVVFVGVGFGSFRLAETAAAWYEARTAEQLETALGAAGQDWVGVEIDGLRVTLVGAAPDETSRFRALEITRQVVNSGWITDTTTLRASAPLPPAPFALELLRNEAEVSLIGLVPETGGRDVIRSALRAGGLSGNVNDMLETASDDAPAGWPEALGFGLSVLADLPRAKVSVAPGQVKVIAVADSDADREALEARLSRAAPDGVRLALDISAPRPVISPFAFDFSLGDGVGTLAACSAESTEAAGAILAAARRAGLSGEADCRVGLGAPSPEWSAAVARGIDALVALGGGRFALRDIAAELTPPEGADAGKVNEVGAGLDADLPDVFQLTTAVPSSDGSKGGERVYSARFEAFLLEDGTVRLSGAVKDETSQDAILSYATSLFGYDRVMNTTIIDPSLPEGWPGRVLAGVEALSKLNEGKLSVSADQVAVEGWSLDEHAGEGVEALLAAKVGSGAVVDVSFDAEAAAAAASASRPRPELCADQVNAILEAASIQFAAGSADIVAESQGVIAAIADVLRTCPGADFEIGGHTDSQGSPEANQRLSEARAEAVLAALRAEDLPMVRLTARGFGSDDPVADNATEAGRAENRRIEFTLVAPEGVEALAAGEAGAEETETATDVAADCAVAIGDILGEGAIQFPAGSTEIAAESVAAVEAIGDVLSGCPEARFEIGGYTDSQGSDAGNLRLSQERAEAVLTALRTPERPLPDLKARGYFDTDHVSTTATSS
jgi:OOP family OmpA-OmpF porin